MNTSRRYSIGPEKSAEYQRPTESAAGRAHFEVLAGLASSEFGDAFIRTQMANALAALIAEITPMSRDRLMYEMTRQMAAPGRLKNHKMPPGLANDEHAKRKWAALVLLDCVAKIVEDHAGTHTLEERMLWMERAKVYTDGAEDYPVQPR